MDTSNELPIEPVAAPEPAWRRLNKSNQEKFEDNFQFQVGNKTMTIHQDYAWDSVDTVGLTVWDASLVLAKYVEELVHRQSHSLENKKVLELGSGCGVTGIAAALLDADVTVTDWELIVPLLSKNAQVNSILCKYPVKAIKLKWGVDEAKELGTFDFVLGADLLYQKHAILPLLQTIQRASTPASVILMAYERHNEVPDTFWGNVDTFFDVSKIPYEEHHSVYRHPKIEILQLRHKRDSAPASS